MAQQMDYHTVYSCDYVYGGGNEANIKDQLYVQVIRYLLLF